MEGRAMRGRLILVACPRGTIIGDSGGLIPAIGGSLKVYSCTSPSDIREALEESWDSDRVVLTEAYFLMDSRCPRNSKFITKSESLLWKTLARGVDIILVAPDLMMMQKFLRDRADCLLVLPVIPSNLNSIFSSLLGGLGDRLWDFIEKEGGDKNEV